MLECEVDGSAAADGASDEVRRLPQADRFHEPEHIGSGRPGLRGELRFAVAPHVWRDDIEMFSEPGSLRLPHARVRHACVKKYHWKAGARALVVDARAVELNLHLS